MLRVYRFSRMPIFAALIIVPLLVFVGLPLVLGVLGLAVLGSLLRPLFLRAPSSGAQDARSSWIDPSVSSIITNKEIGPYRIKRSAQDPSIIEVLD